MPARFLEKFQNNHEWLPDPLDWSRRRAEMFDSHCPTATDSGRVERERSRSRDTRAARLRVRRAHLVGMGGSGMRALAELMQDFGCRITGSDSALSDDDRWHMHSRGLRVCAGHAASQLPVEADVLIYSPAVPTSNSERQAARQLGIPQFSLPQALGWLMQLREGVSICGTHGKTTTTALVGHLLGEAGLSPSVVCGGEVRSRQVSGWAGHGRALIVESCEYRRHFLSLVPRHAILLNIEPDHFDCFASLEESIAAYGEFAARLPAAGALVVNRDCPASLQAAQRTAAAVITFGRRITSPSQRHRPPGTVDWSYHRLQRTMSGWSFLVERSGEHFGRFRVPSPVRHNVINALAGIALGHHLGVRRHRLQLGVRTFAGVRRRFEQFALPGGGVLIDDYAHHPSAIAGVLAAARERHPKRRLWCAFQPHQVSRTQALMGAFAESLALADVVLISPVFAAREQEQEGIQAQQTSRELVRLLRRQGKTAWFAESLDGIKRTIETETRPGDVVLTLGAGDIESIAINLLRRRQQPQAS